MSLDVDSSLMSSTTMRKAVTQWKLSVARVNGDACAPPRRAGAGEGAIE